jgi:hypothetical protein
MKENRELLSLEINWYSYTDIFANHPKNISNVLVNGDLNYTIEI